ncbi:dihydrofolate reductase [Parasphingopyxis algicola]|uniref:dihydrofolate reductase family protein n=1 Tax=Parasphingopyxis algicola TaxID=2026624 RepID=UPI0015A2B223|nr:dihydrofolate reductase family protein [Parasphingopyxis algicola]QLC24451.1 dihydrofolate reductase [Parasphingopyxis algicola]
MRELAILTFLTLDGVMQAPSSPDEDGSGGFAQGGWAQDHWDEVMAQVAVEAMHEPYDLLLGRKTYDLFAPHWSAAPPEEGPAAMLNDAVKHVVTSRSDGLDWQNSRPLTGDVGAAVSRLKSEDGALIQVHGSWQLIQALLEHDLIDEYRLWTFPVVLGAGKRLFEDGAPRRKLALAKTAATPGGAVMRIYRRG